MRVSIIVDDNTVVVEGIAATIDCSLLAATSDIHAIQWYGNFGDIEYITDLETGDRAPNHRVTDTSIFQYLVDAWVEDARKPHEAIVLPQPGV